MLLNKGVKYDQEFLTRNGLDSYLCIPMTNELIQIPDEL